MKSNKLIKNYQQMNHNSGLVVNKKKLKWVHLFSQIY